MTIGACRPSLPLHSVKDLIAHAKANGGKVTFGSAGTGSSTTPLISEKGS